MGDVVLGWLWVLLFFFLVFDRARAGAKQNDMAVDMAMRGKAGEGNQKASLSFTHREISVSHTLSRSAVGSRTKAAPQNLSDISSLV